MVCKSIENTRSSIDIKISSIFFLSRFSLCTPLASLIIVIYFFKLINNCKGFGDDAFSDIHNDEKKTFTRFDVNQVMKKEV